ncbi:MAG: hypothetical protein QM608_15935 [Caulobacter sp.]
MAFSMGAPDLWAALFVATLPLLISFACVLAGGLVIGLPTSLILKRRGAETVEAYSGLGALFGAVLPLVLALAAGGSGGAVAFSGLGVLGGGTAGYVWWRSGRPKVVDQAEAAGAEPS